nr:hypothetical protein [Tanacetum cinerariifolium]
MAPLTFADTHNMIAFLTKSDASEGVETPLFDAMLVPQQVQDEVAKVEEDDDNELMETCATLTKKVVNLEHDKVAQALEIVKLKQRVRKLEKKRRTKCSGLKRLKKYALMVNPTIYVSCIKQFWGSVSIKKSNDAVKLQGLIDRKKVIITEDTIRQNLRLDDADGIDCLPNEEIFVELARMGYEKPFTKLTFYKAFFSAQWKFLIHTILQCMSAKRIAWNEFSSSMASAVICLAT